MRRKHLLIQKWRDKREIFMISTWHNGDYELVKSRFERTKLKPAGVAEYNRFMGGVDKADQMTTYYSTQRKTIRWHLKLFFHLLDVSLWNASFLYNFEKTDAKVKLSYINFHDAIISVLLDSSTERNVPPPKEAQHFQYV